MPGVAETEPIIDLSHVSLFYGQSQALKNISFSVREKVVTAFIGPSGCGKSTLLRSLNRMNDLIADHATNIGEEVVYLYEGRDIRHSGKGASGS